jgi:hypothetical protein
LWQPVHKLGGTCSFTLHRKHRNVCGVFFFAPKLKLDSIAKDLYMEKNMEDKLLQQLIENARNHVVLPSERAAQRKSFAFGNTNISNPDVTKSDVVKASQELTERN